MKLTLIAAGAAAALLAAAGCNQTPKSADETVVVKAGDTQQASAAVGEAEAMTRESGAAPAGEMNPNGTTTVTEVVLASGEKLPVYPVAKLDLDPKSVEGRVALEGKVQDIYADKGVFSMVDCNQEAGCKDGCCPNVNIPISVPSDKYQGSLPGKDSNVIVVGNLKVSNAGYMLTVEEVREGENVLMSRKAEGTDA